MKIAADGVSIMKSDSFRSLSNEFLIESAMVDSSLVPMTLLGEAVGPFEMVTALYVLLLLAFDVACVTALISWLKLDTHYVVATYFQSIQHGKSIIVNGIRKDRLPLLL